MTADVDFAEIPRPASARLARKDAWATPPKPPFGLAAFGVDGEATVVLLDLPPSWPRSGFGDLAAIVAQVPEASSLPPGTLVVVLGDAAREVGLLARALGGGKAHVARALRATALLARGYVAIGGGVDPASGADLAWGSAPA